MRFLKKVLADNVVSLKPALKKKKEAEEKPDFSKAKITVSTHRGYGREYSLVVNIPVAKTFLSDPKRGPKEFVHSLHDFLGTKANKWFGTPTLGGLDARAKNGMVNITATFKLSALDAYAYGLNLVDYMSSSDVNFKDYDKRKKEAEAAMKEMSAYREKATKALQGIEDADVKKATWETEYKEDWIKMSDKYKGKGISYLDLKEA